MYFGSFQPFISATHYRVSFIEVTDKPSTTNLKIIEIKVSVGDLGEIYEDGMFSVYIIDNKNLIGPLLPQELKELIILKYKDSIEGAEEARRYATPNLAIARETAKQKKVSQCAQLSSIIEEVVNDVDRDRKGLKVNDDKRYTTEVNNRKRKLVSYGCGELF